MPQAIGLRGGPVNLELHDWLLRLFPSGSGWRPHIFVEAGAHDGHGASQTMWLEDLGWQGLLVEPSLSFMGIEGNRPKAKRDNRVLAGHDGTVNWMEMIGDARELSGIINQFQVDGWDRVNKPHKNGVKECVTLTRMLTEHQLPSVIQFLSLDTEGSEVEILRAHDFNAFRFEAIWCEYNNISSRRTELEEILLKSGYDRVMDTSHDLLFVNRRLL